MFGSCARDCDAVAALGVKTYSFLGISHFKPEGPPQTPVPVQYDPEEAPVVERKSQQNKKKLWAPPALGALPSDDDKVGMCNRL